MDLRYDGPELKYFDPESFIRRLDTRVKPADSLRLGGYRRVRHFSRVVRKPHHGEQVLERGIVPIIQLVPAYDSSLDLVKRVVGEIQLETGEQISDDTQDQRYYERVVLTIEKKLDLYGGTPLIPLRISLFQPSQKNKPRNDYIGWGMWRTRWEPSDVSALIETKEFLRPYMKSKKR